MLGEETGGPTTWLTTIPKLQQLRASLFLLRSFEPSSQCCILSLEFWFHHLYDKALSILRQLNMALQIDQRDREHTLRINDYFLLKKEARFQWSNLALNRAHLPITPILHKCRNQGAKSAGGGVAPPLKFRGRNRNMQLGDLQGSSVPRPCRQANRQKATL